MPSDFRDLAGAQKEVARALQELTSRLEREPLTGDLSRLTEVIRTQRERPALPSRLNEIGKSPSQQAVGRQDATPASTTSRSRFGREQGTVERALTGTTRALRDLDLTLGKNTRALENISVDAAGLLGSFLPGIGGGPRGGGLASFLKGGFGLASLGLRIANLFREKPREPEAPKPFELPAALELEVANTRSILAGFPRVARGQSDLPRVVEQQRSPPAQPQVVVNVNALDTQSFMDRSADVARAVRDAMLHMHPLNDVIDEV